MLIRNVIRFILSSVGIVSHPSQATPTAGAVTAFTRLCWHQMKRYGIRETESGV